MIGAFVWADDTGRHHGSAVFLQMNRTSIRIRYTRRKIGAASDEGAEKANRRRNKKLNKNVDKRECAQIQIDQMAIE